MPAFGIISSTVLASIVHGASPTLGSAGYTVFNTLVFMSGITAAIPYGFSALAQIKWRRPGQPGAAHAEVRARRRGRGRRPGLLDPVHLCTRATPVESLWEEYLPFVFAGVAFLLGIPVYLAQRTRMTEPPAVPPYRSKT